MWTYRPELLERPVPRYTSYPTAADFRDGFGSTDFKVALDSVAPGTPTSLYVHIPYCREICWYCGCNTGAANKTARLDAYLDALHAEIDLVAERLQRRPRVSHIAIGGGSPNAILTSQLEDIVTHVRQAFDAAGASLSIEFDPRGFDHESVPMLRRIGLTHASLGVQTLSPEIQRAIGRVQPAETIAETTLSLRAAGVRSLNFDLMYGLPSQGRKELLDTIDKALLLAPDRLAVFGYAHVPHLLPRQRRIDATALPTQRQRFDQAQVAYTHLTAAGYEPVGFDHFALPADPLAQAAASGQLRRNFQGFTDDQSQVLIGLGATAISVFPTMIVQNEKAAGRYRMRLASAQFAASRGIHVSEADRDRGRIIEALLCQGQVRIDWPRYPEAAVRLAPFEKAGLIDRRPRALGLSADALPYARSIASCFDRFRAVDATPFSSAV